ncbi:hypothetical protein Tco_0823561 [Tanacetum coccineum]|uniref:Uncharacterized protein n=1 Tax=Tanacetum coccineum TaxID=301880 RepID=A0ABQ5AL98_9ASTR
MCRITKSITWVNISAIFNEQYGEVEAFNDASSNLLTKAETAMTNDLCQDIICVWDFDCLNQISYFVIERMMADIWACIERCNNYDVLQSIPCSPECKIVGHILLDHALSYALTAIVDVPAAYLQQLWKTVSKVPDTKDTIRFKLDTQEIVYTVDMFRATLKLPVETLDNPFVVPIRATDDYMKYETVFVNVVVPMNQPQPVVSTQGTHMTTPRAHRTPTLTAASPHGKKRKQSAGETSSPRKSLKVTIKKKKQSTTSIPPPSDDRERDEIAEATLLSLTLHNTALAAEAQENVAKVQEKLEEEEIEKMVKCEEDEESYASEFADSMFNMIPKQDEKKDDDAEKTDDAVEEKENDDHTDHTLVRTHATGSILTRNEQM